jgi:histidine triad (HIT) family protein
MLTCLFCKIVKGEIPAEIVYQDDQTMAFLDIFPKAPGHTVVIPKKHSENLINLEEVGVGSLFLTVKRITGILATSLKPDGFTIGINHGEVAGQTVPHLHVHIIPRFANDGGGNIHSVVNNPPQASIKEIGQKIKNNIN